jgi:hypothetical protein
MILPTRRQLPSLRLKRYRLKAPRFCLASSAFLCCAVALAAPPASQAAPPPQSTPPAGGMPGSQRPDESKAGGDPDDEFIEFLGSDDAGDPAWWEFLKRSAARKSPRSVPPPQDANQ